MAETRTFQDDYGEFEAEVLADSETELNDFSSGSRLDAFAAVAATAAQVARRWIAREVLSAFISGAEGDELDYVAQDRLGDQRPKRQTDESDPFYRARLDEWIDHLERGTVPALRYYASTLDGVISVDVSEDLTSGITTVTVTFDGDETDDGTLQDAFFADLGAWRADGAPVNFESEEA